jgi:hypothetical protein
MLYIAIGILGATVMPHNLYLHSALVQSRRNAHTPAGLRAAIRFNTIDSFVALNGALLVNAALLVLAGAAFFKAGTFGQFGPQEPCLNGQPQALAEASVTRPELVKPVAAPLMHGPARVTPTTDRPAITRRAPRRTAASGRVWPRVGINSASSIVSQTRRVSSEGSKARRLSGRKTAAPLTGSFVGRMLRPEEVSQSVSFGDRLLKSKKCLPSGLKCKRTD